MALAKLPEPFGPMLNPDGTPTREWYAFFQSLHRIKLGDLTNVDLVTVAPLNGEQLTYNSATQKWKPGTA